MAHLDLGVWAFQRMADPGKRVWGAALEQGRVGAATREALPAHVTPYDACAGKGVVLVDFRPVLCPPSLIQPLNPAVQKPRCGALAAPP